LTELDALQNLLNIQFHDPDLLRQALVHRSYLNELATDTIFSNDRLEFLGDSILGFVVTDFIFHRFHDVPEGRLTDFRSQVVRTETLARVADQLGIGDHLILGRGARTGSVRGRQQILADAMEAVIGAVFIDQGPEVAQDFILDILEDELENLDRDLNTKDDKSRLQEVAQALYRATPVYRTVGLSGPHHDRDFIIEVSIKNEPFGRGIGKNKQTAEQEAARRALEWIGGFAEEDTPETDALPVDVQSADLPLGGDAPALPSESDAP
jgi:ribonuclease-3